MYKIQLFQTFDGYVNFWITQDKNKIKVSVNDNMIQVYSMEGDCRELLETFLIDNPTLTHI
jgi:hypothetical protein